MPPTAVPRALTQAIVKVLFDHQAFSLQRYGGVSRYFYELSTRLARVNGLDVEIVAPFYVSRYFSDNSTFRPRGFSVPDFAISADLRRRANNLVSRAANCRRWDVDVFHETYYSATDAAPPSAARVITVYDMIHEKFPECFSASDSTSRIKRQAVERADHVICISESTRRDLLELTGIVAGKTSVVSLGHELMSASAPESRSPIGEGPFVLYVGSRGGYKNFSAVIEAFAMSRSMRDEFSLVCFGGGPFTPAEDRQLRSSGLGPKKVTQIGGGDEVLAQLYKSAAALVYPSLYEGFGIPPLEAMSFGCPVICANTSSLPEVVGDAAETFDPTEPGAILVAMERVLGVPERARELISLGNERAHQFSWDRCARETLEIYQRKL